jgi:hypothetical protein
MKWEGFFGLSDRTNTPIDAHKACTDTSNIHPEADDGHNARDAVVGINKGTSGLW